MKLKTTYTRRIMAMMYFPDCEPANAMRRLSSEIKRCDTRTPEQTVRIVDVLTRLLDGSKSYANFYPLESYGTWSITGTL